MRRFFAAPCLALALLALGAGPAAADPVNAPGAEPFDVVCAGQTYTIVAGGGPGHVLGSTANLIPAAFVETVTFVDPETGQTVTETFAFGIGRGKRTGQQDVLETCTFALEFEDEFGNPVSVEGAVTLFVTPRGH